MSQGGGSRLSLPGPSTSRTELFPDMLDNYRTKEPQARNTKRKTRQTKSQEPPIQRKPRKKKAAISPPLIGDLSDADSENLDNPPTPTKNKKRNRAPVVSDAESECSLPSPPKTRKKTKAPADSVDNPPAPLKARKTRTRKYAASQPIFSGLPDDDSSAPPETKKKKKKKNGVGITNGSDEDEYHSSDFTVVDEGSQNLDPGQDLNESVSMLDGED